MKEEKFAKLLEEVEEFIGDHERSNPTICLMKKL